MKKSKIIIFTFLITLIFSIFNFSFASSNLELNIHSPSTILIESSTGKIIYEKNAYEKMYPASTTKIMTAILTLEYCDIADTVVVSREAVQSIPYGYSTAYLQIGEELTIYQLLNVLLISSANDAANVLAEHIGGSIESFCSMMNTKAQEIGCLNTNFINASGIQNENHYSTAYDLALIGRYAMQNDTFREIVKTTGYTLPATNKWPNNDRYFSNTNELLLKDSRDAVDNYYYEFCNGIKTGYTDVAKDCIVASARKDNLEFIVVTLGSDRTQNGLSARYLDSKLLFDYALENYSTYKINDANSFLKQIEIFNATPDTKSLDVIVKDEINILINQYTDISSISPDIDINFALNAPIKKNTVIGKITYTIDGISYESDLLAGSDVIESEYFNLFFKLLMIIVALFLLYEFLHLKKKK